MHAILLRTISQLIITCEKILTQGDLDPEEKSHLENALFYLRLLEPRLS